MQILYPDLYPIHTIEDKVICCLLELEMNGGIVDFCMKRVQGYTKVYKQFLVVFVITKQENIHEIRMRH
jgi:hypothetical protein